MIQAEKRSRTESGSTGLCAPLWTLLALTLCPPNGTANPPQPEIFDADLSNCLAFSTPSETIAVGIKRSLDAYMARAMRHVSTDLHQAWIICSTAPVDMLKRLSNSALVLAVKGADFFADFPVISKIGSVIAKRLHAADGCTCPDGTDCTAQGVGAVAALAAEMENHLSPNLLIQILSCDQRSLEEELCHFLSNARSALMARLSVLARMPVLATLSTTDGISPIEGRQSGPVVALITELGDRPLPECPGKGFADVSDADLFVCQAAVTDNLQPMFSLVKGSRVLGCALRMRSSRVHGKTISLEGGQCLALCSSSNNMRFSKCHFQGGSLVCSDSCHVSFTSCKFEGCTLVVKAGASVTMQDMDFKDMHKGSGLGVFVTGSGSSCTVRKGRFQHGMQAVAVRDGAHFLGSELDFKHIDFVAVEAADESTTLQLYQCLFTAGMAATCKEMAVAMHDDADAFLHRVNVWGGHQYGVRACSSSTLTMTDCVVDEAHGYAVECCARTRCHLERCTLANSRVGCMALSAESVHVLDCDVTGCRWGLFVEDSVIVAEGCKITDIELEGMNAWPDGVLHVARCQLERCGCGAIGPLSVGSTVQWCVEGMPGDAWCLLHHV